MPLIALLLLSSFSFAADFWLSSSVKETDDGKEIIIKIDRPVSSSEERLQIYEYLEVLAYESCGGKNLYPELQLQEAFPSQESFTSVRRVFRCGKLIKQNALWFRNFVKGSCKKENLFPAMEKVCLKFKGK